VNPQRYAGAKKTKLLASLALLSMVSNRDTKKTTKRAPEPQKGVFVLF